MIVRCDVRESEVFGGGGGVCVCVCVCVAYLELIANVELVRVEQKQNEVGFLSKPLHHTHKVVTPPNALLVTREHTRCVDECEVLENGRGTL
jgi:hypothetical protein